MHWVIKAAASGLVGYALPRLLVGAGVPLDTWTAGVGQWLGAHFDPEAALWGISAFVGLALFGLESWKHPIERAWALVFGNRQNQSEPARNRTTSESVEVPRRDVWLLDAIYYIGFGTWDRLGWDELQGQTSKLGPVPEMVRQKAYDGDLRIWGRDGFSGPHLLIPKEYWEYYGFDWVTLLEGNGEEFQTALEKNTSSILMHVYRSLKTSKSEIERLWPSAATEGSLEEVRSDVSVEPSTLNMSVAETGPYLTTDGSVYGITRTYNLKIENTERTKTVSNCKIYITSIVPHTEYDGPWLLKDQISLAAGDHEFVPLVTYGEAREPEKYPCGDKFMTMGTESGRPCPDADKRYTLTLRATAPEASYRDFRCEVWVSEDGRLRIREV